MLSLSVFKNVFRFCERAVEREDHFSTVSYSYSLWFYIRTAVLVDARKYHRLGCPQIWGPVIRALKIFYPFASPKSHSPF